MASYLAAIISSTGVPLFIRSTGDVPQLSFPVVGSLNGVHWFTDNAKATLLTCTSGHVRIVWKNFHDCLTLILVSTNDSPSETHSSYLLTLIFNAMVLLIGLPDLLKFDDAENLKRELRCCYPLIDLLLSNQLSMSPLTQSTEVVVDHDQKSLMDGLTSFTDAVDSGYGCLLIQHQLLHATDSWWQLDPIDSVLLSLLPSSLPSSQCTDVPVYLPVASNASPHRLLIFHLYDSVSLLVLCDTEPSLDVAQKVVLQTWLPLRDRIIGLPLLVPRCLPLSVSIDTNVLGLCFVNLITRRSLLSLLSSDAHESKPALLSKGYQGTPDIAKRRAYLIQFYKTVVDDLIPVQYQRDTLDNSKDTKENVLTKDRVPHTISETYSCTKAFKGYAINKNHHNLFVLFDVNTPTYALRHLSHDILETLITRRVL